jgi:hypothetical protein
VEDFFTDLNELIGSVGGGGAIPSHLIYVVVRV